MLLELGILKDGCLWTSIYKLHNNNIVLRNRPVGYRLLTEGVRWLLFHHRSAHDTCVTGAEKK